MKTLYIFLSLTIFSINALANQGTIVSIDHALAEYNRKSESIFDTTLDGNRLANLARVKKIASVYLSEGNGFVIHVSEPFPLLSNNASGLWADMLYKNDATIMTNSNGLRLYRAVYILTNHHVWSHNPGANVSQYSTDRWLFTGITHISSKKSDINFYAFKGKYPIIGDSKFGSSDVGLKLLAKMNDPRSIRVERNLWNADVYAPRTGDYALLRILIPARSSDQISAFKLSKSVGFDLLKGETYIEKHNGRRSIIKVNKKVGDSDTGESRILVGKYKDGYFPQRGWSGSPVISNNKVVGILGAVSFTHNYTYVFGIEHVSKELNIDANIKQDLTQLQNGSEIEPYNLSGMVP